MSNSRLPTTLGIPVKVVREAALVSLEHRRERLKQEILRIVRGENRRREKVNKGWFYRLFPSRCLPALDPLKFYEDSLRRWYKGERCDGPEITYQQIDEYHVSFDISLHLYAMKSSWWKRLEQFADLPKRDDERVIQMSMEDLTLIQYKAYIQAQEAQETEQ